VLGLSDDTRIWIEANLDLHIVTKAGGCRSGSDRGGTVWHYVKGDPARVGAALCGDAPRIQWSSWEPEGRRVTCKKCLRAANDLRNSTTK
jgi:hypothetical protein